MSLPASTRTTKVVKATQQQVYDAFMNPDLLVRWLPPAEMTGKIHMFDGRVGGGYRMSLLYPETETKFQGKTADREVRVEVRFTALSPPDRITEAITFVTTEPSLMGEVTMTATFETVSEGTEVTLLFENLPPGIRPEDNDASARLSLYQLARLFD